MGAAFRRRAVTDRSRRDARTPRPLGRGRRSCAEPTGAPAPPARSRFLRLDRYRVDREWERYEGTPQRDLFREIRMRFLGRHAIDGRWTLDVGSGPGRFTGSLGGPSSHHVALDLSRTSLTVLRERAEPRPGITTPLAVPVQGDASHPPFLPSAFQEVALLGNSLGFGGDDGVSLLGATERLVAPGGTLLLEIAPGPGERSRYLSRLPPGSVARLLASPPPAVIPRILKEGFTPLPLRRPASGFRRWKVPELIERWGSAGWEVAEVLAVAPALGAEPGRISAARASPRAWKRLLELEEILGRDADRWAAAAAVLLAARRPPLNGQD